LTRQGFLRRHRGFILALALSGAVIGFRWHVGGDPLQDHHPSYLPGFDSWVYVTMADFPPFFTLPPWGYRLLGPSIVHQLPVERPRGFLYLTIASLVTAGVLIFLFLRRLGNGEAASLLAVIAFGFSPPVRTSLDNYFLGEPLTTVLIAAFLLAIEAGSGLAVLSLIAVAGTLSKEIMLALLPVIWLARRGQKGDRRALLETGIVAVPAILVLLTFRFWWTPYVTMPPLSLDIAYFRDLLEFGRNSWVGWLKTVSLGGLTVLAVLGALRKTARPFLRRYGYVLAAITLLPLINPYPYALPFLATEYNRYLLLALPCLLPLCLLAVDRFWRHRGSRVAPSGPNRVVELLAVSGVLLLLASPFVLADPYRRADPGLRRGRFVRAFLTHSLGTARRLEEGKRVVWDMATTRPAAKRDPDRRPLIVRWFLRDGWGVSRASYSKDVVMSEEEAGFLLPCFVPQDTRVALSMHAPQDTVLDVYVNGLPVGKAKPRPARQDYTFRIPAEALFRGDNLVTVASKGRGGLDPPRLRRITLRPLPRTSRKTNGQD
jgi:hypothetical protein